MKWMDLDQDNWTDFFARFTYNSVPQVSAGIYSTAESE